MQKNIPMLRTVLKHVMRHPELHNQASWLYRTPECGTVGCIAGWAVEMSDRTQVLWPQYSNSFVGFEDAVAVLINERSRTVFEAAAIVLGLDDQEADWLFCAVDLDEVWEIVEDMTDGELKRVDIEAELELESGESDVVVEQS